MTALESYAYNALQDIISIPQTKCATSALNKYGTVNNVNLVSSVKKLNVWNAATYF